MAMNTSKWGSSKAKERYAQGGPIDLGGPFSAGQGYSNSDAANANMDSAEDTLAGAMRNHDDPGKKFWDSGTKIPGKTAAKNLQWEKSHGIKNSIVKD